MPKKNDQPADEPAGTGLAPRASTNLTNAPADAMDFLAERAGQGAERVKMADMVMPRINILQDLSPQVKRTKPEYVDGAQPGQIFNAATREVTDSLLVLPCAYIRHHIEWKPNRGGFVADHGEDGERLLAQCRRNADNYDVLPNGNLLVPTGTWYCIDVMSGQQIVIPMARTQLKPSRQWMSMATSERINHPTKGEFQPPLYFRTYKLTSFHREEGENDWFVFNADRGPTIFELDRPELLARATQFRDLVASGAVRADAAAFSDEGQGVGGQQNEDERSM